MLTPTDADVFLRARVTQLESEPHAFGESADEARAQTAAAVAERLAAPREETFLLGAFADGALVGTAGYFRQREAKTRHKGRVWGVFVARARGFGRLLMRTLIAEAATIDGLEQLDLQVAVTQSAARRLYESLGFSVYGREPHALKIGDLYVDEDLLVLRLPTPDSRLPTPDSPIPNP
jgi:RimJ/RimL family protein N-acetyltransferase